MVLPTNATEEWPVMVSWNRGNGYEEAIHFRDFREILEGQNPPPFQSVLPDVLYMGVRYLVFRQQNEVLFVPFAACSVRFYATCIWT
jgi:hypothetical protein